MAANGLRRVVVTGVGLVTPLGNDVDTTWNALLAGKSGGARITHFEPTDDFDVRFACEVKGFEPEQYMDRKEVRRTDRFAQLAMAAAQQAMADAGLDDADARYDRDRTGVVIGSGIGGIATFEDQARVMVAKGPKRISPFFIPMFIPDIAAGHVSMRWGLRGPNYCTVSACASSAHAVGDALRLVQR
ncbi:MAG: beta-ketoacyl synthase N-terminal-like domain-containing protein, partial [Longimicrobiales bacterium]